MKKRCCVWRGFLVIGILAWLLVSAFAQKPADDEKIWESFKAWILKNPPKPTLKAYGEKLAEDGLSREEIEMISETIRRLYEEHPERGVEITYDRIFSKPLTGDPEKDGFTSTPSVFMMESVRGLDPGKALDVGAGQGRNAVWLAQKGWDVTAIDISGVGLAVAADNAEKAGTSITTVKTSYQDFDFGTEQWDLIVMILSWAPVSDTSFVARLNKSLSPGGVVVFEHVLETEKQSFPPVVQGLPPNALLAHFKDFYIQKYEEGVWLGDWGGPPAELVRMIARKKQEKKSVRLDDKPQFEGDLEVFKIDESRIGLKNCLAS
jgi:2-polyprenyl-3-methyl-5-hydroxy-6-metoxy-1,4-benzoquinol methylase